MQGWRGKALRIDLDKRQVMAESLPRDIVAKFIGGRGLAARYLQDELASTADPLSPDNIIVIAIGPLAGTNAPAASRYTIASKSPLTGRPSFLNAGGHFGAELAYAGYDAIIIRGRAETPSYIWIENNSATIAPAAALWGKTNKEVAHALRKQTRNAASAISIGPAGERMVPIASINSGGLWQAGGAGLGAVMGSKNLKAIAVKGSGQVGVAYLAAFSRAVAGAVDRIAGDHLARTRLPAYGSGALVHVANDHEMLPTQNFQHGHFAAAAKISGEAVADDLLLRSFACFGCPVACGRRTRGGSNGQQGEGPEFEHLWAFGSNCGIDDLATIANATYICHELGIDAVEAGCAIAVAMDLISNGFLSVNDVGSDLRFGDGRQIATMLRDIAAQVGFGRDLGEGGARLAEKAGQPGAFAGIYGTAFAAFNPRNNEALALHYATSHGADDHLAAALRLMDASDTSLVKHVQDEVTAILAAGICPLLATTLTIDDVAAMLSSATGIRYEGSNLLEIGARIWQMESELIENSTCSSLPSPASLITGKQPTILGQDISTALEGYLQARKRDKR